MKEHDKGISDFFQPNPVRTRKKPQLSSDVKL